MMEETKRTFEEEIKEAWMHAYEGVIADLRHEIKEKQDLLDHMVNTDFKAALERWLERKKEDE